MRYKMCEDCGKGKLSHGLQIERKKRWCRDCAISSRPTAIDMGLKQMRKMCEDCGLKHPTYGLQAERKRRWCAKCAKSWPGAADLQVNKPPPCTA